MCHSISIFPYLDHECTYLSFSDEGLRVFIISIASNPRWIQRARTVHRSSKSLVRWLNNGHLSPVMPDKRQPEEIFSIYKLIMHSQTVFLINDRPRE